MTKQSDEHLTPPQLAKRWDMSPQSLAQWRYLGRGPAYIKIGTKVLYPFADVLEYERAHTVVCSGAA
ncbi:helix-turn-helix domain-containing protein [Nocardia nova]|uniref:helix-turn-helix transcriptional regulator n=1 Tax=Nocardia nova TaxID=37330 RepID=UPI001C46AC54|nr:helix-turn-helix domain-containing protein [Nocardia nova]MBV7701912.1 helix-turn-helix domain-containing protein [Nocardia nova]